MKKIKYLWLGLFLMIALNCLGGRVEQGFLIISNNFTVTGTSTLSRVEATGNFYMDTNAVVFGTNALTQYGGVLNGTNGIYWTYNGTNYWLLITP